MLPTFHLTVVLSTVDHLLNCGTLRLNRVHQLLNPVRNALRRLTVGGRPVQLTATEFELLRLLTMNAGRVSTYESLIRQLWNGPDTADPDRVRTFIKQLRRKLGDDPARAAYILNERGVGYRMPRPEE